MGKLLGISIQNYGPLKNVQMGRLDVEENVSELNNMVVVIGGSGNGKSMLADAFGFISDCLSMDVESACDAGNRGGYDQLVSKGTKGPIHFKLNYKETSTSQPIIYELTIDKDKNGRPFVEEEDLYQRSQIYHHDKPVHLVFLEKNNDTHGNRRTKVGYPYLSLMKGRGFVIGDGNGGFLSEGNKVDLGNSRKLGIGILGEIKQFAVIEHFLEFLKSWYLCYFSPDAARQLQTAGPMPHLNRTGSNLNNVVQFMYRENPLEFKKILSEIQTKIPNISNIEPVKLLNGQVVLQFKQEGFKEPFYSPRMSDGTLKLLAYYLLLHEKNPRHLVFIEEPENGLYHQYLGNLASEMKRNAGNGFAKQLFVTTHSPFFVNALAPEEVWVLEKGEDGFSSVKRASEYKFVSDLVTEGANMGDLWYSKYFG